MDIQLYNSSIYDKIFNYSFMKSTKLFDKEFKYQEISDEEVLLIYKYDNNFYITIKLTDCSACFNLDGNLIYDENGNIVMLEDYDFLDFIKENKEFSNSLRIEIDKK